MLHCRVKFIGAVGDAAHWRIKSGEHMPSIFISYAQQDQATAKRLTADLVKRDIKIWFDQQEILVGDSISERIREGIRSADYLLVLLSTHSRQSTWVEHEIGVAFEKFGDEASTAIIPVRIDDSPVSPLFATIKYVDLSKDYNKALSEIISRIERDKTTKVDLSKVINADDLADDMASDRTIRRGAEFYVTAFLSILSIIATLIAAWPAFHGVIAKVPKVYYDLRTDIVSLPPGTDEQKLLKALKDAGIAPAALRVRIINKGQAPAKNVKIGSKTVGKFLYVNPTPPVSLKTVWVKVSVDGFNSGDKDAVVQLKDLVPEKKVIIDFGYEPTKATAESDVVTAGLLAERVPDVDHVQQWSLLQALKLPIQIFVLGILLSILVGIVLAARTNPRLRNKLFDLLDAISPLSATTIKIFFK